MPVRGDFLDRRWMFALLVLAAAIPLLWPQIPPLIDLPGHMGRYRIQTAIDESPSLAAFYSFEWRLLGNLGVDLLIEPLAPLLGVETATKLIVLLVPPIAVGGMLWLAREVHGRVPPTALFALPLAYSFPFQFGFINFALSASLAFCALALWIRWSKPGRIGLRTISFVAISCLLWVTHMVGWGLFGIAAFGAELVRQRRAGRSLVQAGWHAGLACALLGLPLIPMALALGAAENAPSFDYFNWEAKQYWVSSLLRDRWRLFDVASGWLLILIAGFAAIKRRMDALLAVPALLCLIAFILMPRVAVGSAYADMRLLPFTSALGLLAIRSAGANKDKWVAAAAILFFATRLTATTVSFLLYDRDYRQELRALDHLPRGASVLALIDRPCGNVWTTRRFDHLPAMIIVRRDGFSNDQWTSASAQLVDVVKAGVGRYGRDPSQLLYPKECSSEDGSDFDQALADFNRAAFDHVWTINVGQRPVAPNDLKRVWTNGRSALYRVEKMATIETPAGSGTRPTK